MCRVHDRLCGLKLGLPVRPTGTTASNFYLIDCSDRSFVGGVAYLYRLSSPRVNGTRIQRRSETGSREVDGCESQHLNVYSMYSAVRKVMTTVSVITTGSGISLSYPSLALAHAHMRVASQAELPEHVPEHISDHASDRMPEHMPEHRCEHRYRRSLRRQRRWRRGWKFR